MTEWELLDRVRQLLQSVANEHFKRRQGDMPTSLSSPAYGFSCESKQLPILGTFWLFRSLETGCCPGGGSPSPLGSPVCFYSEPLLMSLKKGHIHNQKRPHTNRGHIQNFNVEKWSDKSALFLIILGFYRGFLWQCSILIPTPLYHVALPHLKTILKSRTVAPKLFCIGLPLFEARYRKWSIQFVFANNVELDLKKMRYLKYHMRRRHSLSSFLRSHHSLLLQHKIFCQ